MFSGMSSSALDDPYMPGDENSGAESQPFGFLPPSHPAAPHVAQPVAQPVPQAGQYQAAPYTQQAGPAPHQAVAPVEPARAAQPSPAARPGHAADYDVAGDLASIIGFDPDTVAAEAPVGPSTGARAYVAPAPARPPLAVPIVDPRGEYAPADEDDFARPFQPETPLTLPPGRPEIERLLAGLVHADGSDLHMTHGEIPRYRVHGELLPVGGEQVVVTAQIEQMLSAVVPEDLWREYLATGDADFAYAMSRDEGAAITARFRVNLSRSMGEAGVVFRYIPSKIVGLDELGILPFVKTLASRKRGLVLICGPTGSGKSTTLAGLVDLINQTRADRIWTLEDPIEFVHTSKKALINHREVGRDTASFVDGLKFVRRQDPDIILVGEMRDYETIAAAIEAADTGHLVLSTLHTTSAPETINRIINVFPAERQSQIKATLAESLIAVICQQLVPSKTSPRGRVVAQEIMVVTPAVANNIRKSDIPAIRDALTDRDTGSISRDAHLHELVMSHKITRADALAAASEPEALKRQMGEVTT